MHSRLVDGGNVRLQAPAEGDFPVIVSSVVNYNFRDEMGSVNEILLRKPMANTHACMSSHGIVARMWHCRLYAMSI